jgi:hypothetical protein
VRQGDVDDGLGDDGLGDGRRRRARTSRRLGAELEGRRRRDKKWYEAEIAGVGSTYKVMYTFAENVEDNVDPARIRKTRWAKKNHVEAQVGDAWRHGTVVARRGSGDYSYDIAIDGGDTQTFTAAQVRCLRKPKTAAAPAGTSANASAPCPALTYIMRCGGTCIDTHEDFNNCGSCGHRCQSGGRCDSLLSRQATTWHT